MGVTSDGQGFSGTDAPLGHALAEKDTWSPRETRAAIDLLVKYKKQLDKGSVDRGEMDLLRENLNAEIGQHERLRKREIVKGRIWVDSDRIVLQTNYNEALVKEQRNLLGTQWDGIEKKRTCSLCAENAQAVEDIALRYGLSLKKSKNWDDLVPVRRVYTREHRVIIQGVQAWAILKTLPELGKAKANQSFRALDLIDSTTIAIPLRSWIIGKALLWLMGIGEGDDNYPRLAWARDEVCRLLEQAYRGALQSEREQYACAAATTLVDEKQGKLRALLPANMAKRLMPHQWCAVQSIVDFPQMILADQQGLGKTIEILAALEATNAFPAIILAPTTALLNWRDEAADWLPHRKVAVLGGGITKRDAGVPVDSAELLIINYESFDKKAADLAAVRPKALIADEAQYLKTHDSKRTKAVKEFCKTSGVGRIVASTGTPVMNRPSELLTLLTLLPDLLNELGGFAFFAERYCRATLQKRGFNTVFWDFSGADNLGELANRLRESGRFIRREKSQVLRELPEKQRESVVVEISNRLEYTQATEDFAEWLKQHGRQPLYRRPKVSADPEADEDATAWAETVKFLGWGDDEIAGLSLDGDDRHEALRRMGALRQLAGVGKIQAAVDWIRRTVKDQKLVVFAYHIEVQQALIDALSVSGVSPLSITGDMTLNARRESIRRFQEDAQARVIVCSLKAAQTAITLTAAQRVLFVELDWTPAALQQGEDRTHRIGQTKQVEITYLRGKATLDEHMSALLERKRAIIATVESGAAVHGYRPDGLPRKQAPGPGRPSLDIATRTVRRQASKAGWQARNKEYMRNYMRLKRGNAKIKEARADIKVFKTLERLGWRGMMNEVGSYYTEADFAKELHEARTKAERAGKVLQRLDGLVNVKDEKQISA